MRQQLQNVQNNGNGEGNLILSLVNKAIHLYLFLQFINFLAVDTFEISEELKDIGYSKNWIVLLVILRAIIKIMELFFSGPLRIYVLLGLLESIRDHHPEVIDSLRAIKRLIG